MIKLLSYCNTEQPVPLCCMFYTVLALSCSYSTPVNSFCVIRKTGIVTAGKAHNLLTKVILLFQHRLHPIENILLC